MIAMIADTLISLALGALLIYGVVLTVGAIWLAIVYVTFKTFTIIGKKYEPKR